MNLSNPIPPAAGRPLPRNQYLQILQVAQALREHRFAREEALHWLTTFPGDLQAGLVYAQALIGEGRTRQAVPILEGLAAADPEFSEALAALVAARPSPEAVACLWALGGPAPAQDTVTTWGGLLRQARESLAAGDAAGAARLVQLSLGADPSTALAAVTHLQVLAADERAPLGARLDLARFYHRRWPDCLQFGLLLAGWLMEAGETDEAVALLHEGAARDVNGQVIFRLWGASHPYRSLWPERLELPLAGRLPAAVSAHLGWNQLQAGGAAPQVAGPLPPLPVDQPAVVTLPVVEKAAGLPDSSLPAIEAQPSSETPPAARSEGTPLPPPVPLAPPEAAAVGTPDEPLLPLAPAAAGTEEEPEAEDPFPTPEMPPAPGEPSSEPELLQSVQAELERVAGQMNQPGISRLDGRFPIYVIFSVAQALQAQYGVDGASRVIAAMRSLEEAIGTQHGWGARLLLADEPESTLEVGLKPARPGDAWGLKLALADLDNALAKRGEMIGAVLIVGGPEIVPFHCLPNPVDDQDSEIPSDNPYATRDENYFIPEWPVGRLPGGAGRDPSLLLAALGALSARYRQDTQRLAWYRRWWRWLAARLWPRWAGPQLSFGYTAAVWRKASLSVFDPVGEARAMLVSPPLDLGKNGSTAPGANPPPDARLAYFNLHGLADSGEWYGQRDPLETGGGPDYPVALRPADIAPTNGRTGCLQVVFSEACYGAYIDGKPAGETLALRFLAAGAEAVVGSTAMAYGSIASPLIAADLLGHSFWQSLRDGLPAGEALRRAKIHLAREMHRRQGYLDGEDQKTLISFVLYGDPLAQPFASERSPKSVRRPSHPVTGVKTVCDRTGLANGKTEVPPELQAFVKHVVAQYLPGMDNAHITFSRERAECHEPGHTCPTGQMRGKNAPSQPANRNLVTLSKQVSGMGHIHTQYARLTLDTQGKLVKLVVSR